MADIQSKAQQASQKNAIEKEKLQVARENMVNDEKIARLNAKNRASKSKK